MDRAAQSLLDHRLELCISQRTLLFEVRADARQFASLTPSRNQSR